MVSPIVDAIGCPLCFVSVGNVHDILIHIQIVEVQSVSSFGQVVLHVFVIAASVIGIGDGKICKIGIIRSLALPPVCSLDTVKLLAIDMIAATDTQIDISPRIVVILEIDPVT